MSILAYHHMIPQFLRGHSAFRDIDGQALGVDSFANGIYLPVEYRLASDMGISPHPGGHNALYYEAVERVLNQISVIPEPEIRAAKIRALMDAMRIGFDKGELYTNVPIEGTTLEEVQQAIKNIIENKEAYLEKNPDLHQAIKDREQKGLETGHEHLTLWSAIRGHARREELLSKAVEQDTSNITSGNKHLGGTQYSRFTPVEDDFRIPPSTPANPTDAPLPPPFFPPFLQWLNKPEGLDRSDPRFTGALPGFPAPDPNQQRLGQLPPSTAMPSPPQVLQFNDETGDLFKLSDGSPMLGPDRYNLPHDQADGPAVLGGTALFAAAMAAPALIPLLPVLAPMAGLGLAGIAAARGKSVTSKGDAISATGATPANALEPNSDMSRIDETGYPLGPRPAGLDAAGNPLNQGPENARTFDDRFGHWRLTPDGIMPDPPSSVGDPPMNGAVAPEEVRRLTRANASNAGSVFTSGSAPVPYLPSTEFSDRFGSWSMTTADSQLPQTSKPVGSLVDQPTYLIPPPIFGTDNPSKPLNADEWFSRWIGPLLR